MRSAATLLLLLLACGGYQVNDTGAGEGETPMRRLTKVELLHTLEDVFGPAFTGDAGELASRLPSDPKVDGLDTGADGLAPQAGYIVQVYGVLDYVVAHLDLAQLCPSGDAGCLPALYQSKGLAILRRPMSDAEQAAHTALYQRVLQKEPHEVALAAVLIRLLQSPEFLYHIAVGDGQGGITDYEMASRLSYLVWETMPDEALFAAAAAGKLHEPADVEHELERMLADSRTQRTLTRFYRGLFRVDELDGVFKDASVYPDFEALRPSMIASADRLIADALAGGNLDDLLTSSDTYVDDALAPLYGLTGPGPGNMVRVSVDPARYAGLLTHPAVLATLGKSQRSAPIIRGVFVLSRLLCSPTDPPPPGAEVIPPDPVDLTTTRAFFASLTAPEGCQGCHATIDPLGFAFEHFDGMGRWRDQDNGYAVDSSGTVTLDGQAVAVSGAVDLVHALAGREDVRRCVVERWFRRSFGRSVSLSDEAIVSAMDQAFAAEDSQLAALAGVLARTPALYHPHFDLGGR